MSNDDKAAFRRWQDVRREQLGVCISLFLALAVATLGFAVNLFVQPTYAMPSCFAQVFFFFSLFFGLLSILSGSAACLTRLSDFRTTAQIARHRSDMSMSADVEVWRRTADTMGRWTWRLFQFQILMFALQITLLVGSLAIKYWSRLI